QEADRQRSVAAGARRLQAADLDGDAALRQVRHERWIRRDIPVRSNGLEPHAVEALIAQRVSVDGDRLDAIALDVAQEPGERDRSRLKGPVRPQVKEE